MTRMVHIIGAGLSGLAAAVRLARAGFEPMVYEASPHAGGRCRSYFDPVLDCRIDNGNHLLLSGNRHAVAYLSEIGALETMDSPGLPEFPFIDLATNERWTLRPSLGKVPAWLFDRRARVPGAGIGAYFEPLKLAFAQPDATVSEVLDPGSVLFRRLWEPLAVSALNTHPNEGSAALFWPIIKETLGAGGRACRPLIPKQGLSESFVDPAVALIEAHGGMVQLKHRVHRLGFRGERVSELDCGGEITVIDPETPVILATPAPVAADLIPPLTTPQHHRAIVNLHYKIDPPAGAPPFIGLIGGTAEWIFAKPGVFSVTISAADRLVEQPAESLAQTVWQDIRRVFSLPEQIPPSRVVKEKRATFAATPEDDKRRPKAQTAWKNLILAGDWTATGLPSTIEGSIRSGHNAADVILN